MITNLNNNKTIVNKKKVLTNVFSQGIGLMFHKKINNIGYVFRFNKEKLVPLTMFFVFFSIDVLFLDKDKKVVEIKENLKPFSNYIPKKRAKYVIELPQNTIREKQINIGNKLEF